MRRDPTETGGLFIGRRPGTAPIRFSKPPRRAGTRRRQMDDVLASLILAASTLACLLCWGPIPLACLWIGSRVNYATSSSSLGIAASFSMLFALLLGALVMLRRLDHAWILVRRAAGHDQREGAAARLF